MKYPRSVVVLPALLLLAATLGPLGASAASPAPAAPPAVSPRDTHKEFRDAFSKAMTISAEAEMQRLVKKQTPEAISWIMETAEAISVKPSEELEVRMAALRKAWRGSMESDFCDKMYEYFSLLDPVYKKERTKLKIRYDKTNREYWANLEEKDGQTFGLISLKLISLAEQFSNLGDYYFASQCWLLESNCWNEATRGNDADLYKVCKACKNVVALRLKLDLKDRSYTECKSTYDYLAAQGYDGEPGEDGEGGEPGAKGPPKGGVKEKGPSTSIPMTFEMVEKIGTYQRPCYYLDDLFNMWTPLSFRAKGSRAVISTLGEISPRIFRTGSAVVLIDVDGDGTGETKIPLRGRVDPVEFTVGKGDQQRPWGVLTKIGTQTDTYQGIQMNMAPDDNQMMIYLAPGASVVGDLEGTAIRVLDDNMDGIYGSLPVLWGHTGMSEGNNHPELDSVVVGKSKRAVPWSEYQQIGDKWYRLESLKNGLELQVAEAEIETGTLKVSFKGGKPVWLIVRGSGSYENAFFDVSGKGAEVPAGRYKLYYGELRKGNKQQMAKALILPGENTPQVTVEAGKTTTMKLGAPFDFDFKFEQDEKTVTVLGRSVVCTGSADERYERPWNCVPHPEASWRKAGTKKGAKPEKMSYVKSQEDIQNWGWPASWKPFDITLKLQGKKTGVEVQLTEKKNKLFGKVESSWRE